MSKGSESSPFSFRAKHLTVNLFEPQMNGHFRSGSTVGRYPFHRTHVKGTKMDILYRRFILVSALIAAFGALTANLIQETRSTNGFEALRPAIAISCKNQQICDFRGARSRTLVLAAMG